MFEAMERGDLRALYVLGENPAQCEADVSHARHLLEGLDHLVVQDIFLTRTAEMADVVLPAAAAWCESEGTVTNSERRVQRVRKALDPPGDARDDIWILLEIARRLGHDWHYDGAEDDLGRGARAVADAPGHVVRAASRSWAASSGPATTRTAWSRATCTGGCGPTTPPSGAGSAPFSASCSTSCRSTS